MISAQLIAAHNAAMECYRRATLGEQHGIALGGHFHAVALIAKQDAASVTP